MTSRHDIFINAHKALRSELGRMVNLAGKLDFADADALAAFKQDFANLHRFLEVHGQLEDTHIQPLLKDAAPDLEALLARDHPQLDSAGAKLRDTLQAMDTTAPDARAQGHAFYLALAGFTGEYLLHLADEELKVNPALWARFTDAELQSVERKLVADIPPELTPKVLTAMLPSLTRQGLAGLMGGMRAGMPPQVFDNIWKLAQNVLPESSFKQLSADLNV